MEDLSKAIERLENSLKELKNQVAVVSEEKYRNSPHKTFEKGNWVCNDEEWGQVEWVENDCINMPESDGYMGISLYSGSRGFKVCRRDDWELMSKEDVNYLVDFHSVIITGAEIQELVNTLEYKSRSISQDRLLKKLIKVGRFTYNR